MDWWALLTDDNVFSKAVHHKVVVNWPRSISVLLHILKEHNLRVLIWSSGCRPLDILEYHYFRIELNHISFFPQRFRGSRTFSYNLY